MKILVRTLLILLGLVVLLVLGLGLYGGPLLRVATEKGATYAFGVECKVGRGSLNVLTGNIALADMVIPNPKGFTTPEAFRLGLIEVDAKMTSLLSDTVVVQRLELKSPEITIEQGPSGTNLGELMKHAQEVTGGGKKEEGEKKEGGKKVRVELLRITGAKVRLAGGDLKPLGSVTIPMPDIEKRNLEGGGGSGEGMEMGKLMMAILAEVTRGASQLSGNFPADLARQLQSEAERATRGLDGELKKAGENVKQAVDAAAKEIGDILKKK